MNSGQGAVCLRRHFLLLLDDLLAVVREFLCPERSACVFLKKPLPGLPNSHPEDTDVADILKTHHFMSGEDIEQTLPRYRGLDTAKRRQGRRLECLLMAALQA
jgi:hypothetical protein